MAHENYYAICENKCMVPLKPILDEKGNTFTKRLKNVTVTASAWVSDSTFEDYAYKADITVSGVTEADWLCTMLTPDHTDNELQEILSPYTRTTNNKLTIWAKSKPGRSVKFENIALEKAV